MTDREYTLRAAQFKGITIIKPTKGSPGILGINWSQKDATGVYPCVIDAQTWAQARAQINNYIRP